MRGLRELAPQVGVIFLTAFGTVPDAVQAIREGASDYLVKPVCFDQLKEAAERVLARASASAQARKSDENFVGESRGLREFAGARPAGGANRNGCAGRQRKAAPGKNCWRG